MAETASPPNVPWSTDEILVAATFLAVTLQLVVAPLLQARSIAGLGVVATAATGVFALSLRLGPSFLRSRAKSVALLAVVGLSVVAWTLAFFMNSRVHFEPAARVIAALSVLAYVASIAHWVEQCAPRMALAIESPPGTPRSPPPPLQRLAHVLLAASGLGFALVLPVVLSARAARAVLTESAVAMTTARDALLHATGLCVAAICLLFGGPRLLRGRQQAQPRRLRAMALLVWAIAFGGLWWWSEQSR
ncbi:MAG: hypothetical protein Q8Q09_11735 [Deltaproteobacteria bacterium]|nr:hypothetical protein [Deltaproteobacteria bacterium]